MQTGRNASQPSRLQPPLCTALDIWIWASHLRHWQGKRGVDQGQPVLWPPHSGEGYRTYGVADAAPREKICYHQLNVLRCAAGVPLESAVESSPAAPPSRSRRAQRVLRTARFGDFRCTWADLDVWRKVWCLLKVCSWQRLRSGIPTVDYSKWGYFYNRIEQNRTLLSPVTLLTFGKSGFKLHLWQSPGRRRRCQICAPPPAAAFTMHSYKCQDAQQGIGILFKVSHLRHRLADAAAAKELAHSRQLRPSRRQRQVPQHPPQAAAEGNGATLPQNVEAAPVPATVRNGLNGQKCRM